MMITLRKTGMMLVIALVWVGIALAHNPRVERTDWSDFENPYVIEDGDVSFAFFGYLDSAEDIDVFQIIFEDETPTLHIDDFVPVCGAHYADFYLDYVVLADDYATASDYEDLELPFELPEDAGILFASERPEYDENTDERPYLYEHHTRRDYYESPEYDIELPAAGQYWLVLYNADGLAGDYLLATGILEQFFAPLPTEPEDVATNTRGLWLHRDCAKSPDDPTAIINIVEDDNE